MCVEWISVLQRYRSLWSVDWPDTGRGHRWLKLKLKPRDRTEENQVDHIQEAGKVGRM